MLKKIFAFILKHINKYFTLKKVSVADELEPVFKLSEELVCMSETSDFESAVEAVDSAAAMKYAQMLKENIYQMMRTVDVDEFCNLYQDSIFITENICELGNVAEKIVNCAGTVSGMLNSIKKEKKDLGTGKVVCCGVTFGRRKKEYYYLATENRFTPGEYVCVPTGENMALRVGRIVSIKEPSECNIPTSVKRLKNIESWVLEDVREKIHNS